MRSAAFAALSVSLSACSGVPDMTGIGPLGDPRDRPFVALSDRPNLPNVERAADMSGCSGQALRARSADVPDYPARGWALGLQGWSIVQFDVSIAGDVNNVRIARGVPGGSFDREALRAVEDWQFAPIDSALTGCTVLFEFTQGEVRVR
jgi:TonB family protein